MKLYKEICTKDNTTYIWYGEKDNMMGAFPYGYVEPKGDKFHAALSKAFIEKMGGPKDMLFDSAAKAEKWVIESLAKTLKEVAEALKDTPVLIS